MLSPEWRKRRCVSGRRPQEGEAGAQKGNAHAQPFLWPDCSGLAFRNKLTGSAPAVLADLQAAFLSTRPSLPLSLPQEPSLLITRKVCACLSQATVLVSFLPTSCCLGKVTAVIFWKPSPQPFTPRTQTPRKCPHQSSGCRFHFKNRLIGYVRLRNSCTCWLCTAGLRS